MNRCWQARAAHRETGYVDNAFNSVVAIFHLFSKQARSVTYVSVTSATYVSGQPLTDALIYRLTQLSAGDAGWQTAFIARLAIGTRSVISFGPASSSWDR